MLRENFRNWDIMQGIPLNLAPWGGNRHSVVSMNLCSEEMVRIQGQQHCNLRTAVRAHVMSPKHAGMVPCHV